MGSTFEAAGDRDRVVTRSFDAPRERIWEVWTGCEHLPAWSGPAGWTLAACEVDLRPGGTFRYVWRSPEGMEVPNGGTDVEVVPNQRLVSTHGEGGPAETTHALDLLDEGDRTTLRYTVRYPSAEIRDAALAPVMRQGMDAGYDRLEALLATLG